MNNRLSTPRCIGRLLIALVLLCMVPRQAGAQLRRTIDAKHPMWLIHIDVWNAADPQKIIDLIPEDIKPYVVLNLSLSCQYDTQQEVYKMPQNAVLTYKSWASICCLNNMWFTCQPASGGHTHIQDDDLDTFEYFFINYKNFLGWNYAEQFWGFDEPGDKSSSTQASRWALFAKLVNMAHEYGGLLIESFCGNIWSHPLNPVGQLKRDNNLYTACKNHPENYLLLFKYTTSSCWYNNESVCLAPFISGFAANYGVRYDNCGWNTAVEAFAKNKGDETTKRTYPASVGIGTVMEQTALNGACVWDGPELIWTEDFKEVATTTVNGYKRRNWETYSTFDNIWVDLFRKVIDGTLYIPTRQEVVDRTKIAIVSDISAASDNTSLKVKAYATPETLYDGLYKQDDPINLNNGYYMDNLCYFKKTGRYQAIPILLPGYDEMAATIPNISKMSNVLTDSKWTNSTLKIATFRKAYPEEYTGNLYVARHHNEWVTYYPFSCYNSKRTASALVPLKYNTCERMELEYSRYNCGLIREYADRIEVYFNNYRTDATTYMKDVIRIVGAKDKPTYTYKNRSANASISGALAVTDSWDDQTATLTIEVSHVGPVDLSISCSGNDTAQKLNDYLDESGCTAPEQPDAEVKEIIIEAENMDYKDIGKCETSPYGANPTERGHSAMGYMHMGTSTTAALTTSLNITAAQAGSYSLKVRYTSPSATPTYRVTVGSQAKTMRLQKTAEQNDWQEAEAEVTLKEGKNQITLRSITSSANALIDQIRLVRTGDPSDARPALRAAKPAEAEARYDLQGRRTTGGTHGLHILKMKDGQVIKALE